MRGMRLRSAVVGALLFSVVSCHRAAPKKIAPCVVSSATREIVESHLVDLSNFKLIAAKSRGESGPEIMGFSEGPRLALLPTSKFNISFDLINKDLADDFVVWTSVEFVFGPMANRFTSGKLDPVDWMSWGWDGLVKDLQMTPVYFLTEDNPQTVVVGPVDLGPLIKDASEPYDIWPWAFRIKVHILSREGRQQIFTSRIYRIAPSANRVLHATDYDPTVPEGEPVRAVEENCIPPQTAPK